MEPEILAKIEEKENLRKRLEKCKLAWLSALFKNVNLPQEEDKISDPSSDKPDPKEEEKESSANHLSMKPRKTRKSKPKHK